jgi:hypothetical protein
MGQMVQLVGAMLILSAYIASQQNRMRLDSVQFLGMNMVGAAILTVVAYVNRDYGFLLLEFVWTWVSARGFRKAYKAEQIKKAAQKPDKTKGRPNRPHQKLRRGNRPNPLRKVE